MAKTDTRELVLQMLLDIFAEKEYSHVLIRAVLDKYDYLSLSEKAFMKRLTEGTLERQLQLDYVINQFSKVPVHKMKPFIRALLRMSVYQILFMDSVPDSAACNEAVKLATAHKFSSLKGFVNGVLRNIARNRDSISYPKKEENMTAYYSVAYSMPEWIVEKLLQTYGEKDTESILQGLLEEHPVTVRLAERLTEAEQKAVLEKWQQAGISWKAFPGLPKVFALQKTEGVTKLPGFMEGLLTVQDVSSILVGENLSADGVTHVMDVCSAPGGKACHIAEKLQGTGTVIARDLADYKVERIRENTERLGLTNVEHQVWDALKFDETKKEWADILLCDLPCSGFGVMGKKRDIKYRAKAIQVEEIVALQKKILQTVWPYVKKGGILLYSTCTILPEENQEMVQWIVKELPFTIEKMWIPDTFAKREDTWGTQLLPGIHPCDGFFFCKLRRV